MTIITIKSGKIRGTILKSWKNTEFIAFRGIPFACPPVNNFRFKDPVPISSWNTILDCTTDGPMCPQPRKSPKETSEDCLRINVYTKTVLNNNNLKPVLVYIHGGGLYVGSGVSDDNGGPEYLMEKDIVLVTFNYRLGFLGFFNMGTKEYPGNAGLKDQVLALKWVKDNIASFGGDPNRVTLIGNSAGATCVILHTISPMSKGLFHQAIVASGGINFQTEVKRHQRDLIKKQADILGIKYKSDVDLIKSFKNIPVEKFVETLYNNFDYGRDNPIFLWSYVIEDDYGQERFLTEDPRISLANGRFSKVPIMAGVTANELTTSALDILRDQSLSKNFIKNFNKVAPICFGYERDTEKSKIISDTLLNAYRIPESLTIDTALEPLAQLFSDAMIGYANYCAVKIFREYQSVFQYKFSYIGRHSFLCFPGDKPYGAEHCDDFIYLFVNRRYFPQFTIDDPEAIIIVRLTEFVANFCANGVPSKCPNGMEWKKNSVTDPFYMEIGTESIGMKQNIFRDRYSIWEKLFPLKDFEDSS